MGAIGRAEAETRNRKARTAIYRKLIITKQGATKDAANRHRMQLYWRAIVASSFFLLTLWQTKKQPFQIYLHNTGTQMTGLETEWGLAKITRLESHGNIRIARNTADGNRRKEELTKQ